MSRTVQAPHAVPSSGPVVCTAYAKTADSGRASL